MAYAKDPIKMITIAYNSGAKAAVTENAWTTRSAGTDIKPRHAGRCRRASVPMNSIIRVTFGIDSNTLIRIAKNGNAGIGLAKYADTARAGSLHTAASRSGVTSSRSCCIVVTGKGRYVSIVRVLR